MVQTTKQKPWAELGLPPYGHLSSEWLVSRGKPAVPDHFVLNAKTPSLAEWMAWLENLTDEIAEFLWPRYDGAGGVWLGNAVDMAIALTQADLDLMASLHEQLWQPVASRITGSVLHRVMFAEEDVEPPGHGYARYDAAMSADFVAALPAALLQGIARVRAPMLMLKQRFQRPRPYQAALLLGRSDFFHLSAKSGNTPSLVSGHCLQGAIGGCAAFVRFRPDLEAVSRSTDFLQQLAVDPGDRRVFAGVHYPSDNIASWFCALRSCENFFAEDGKEVKAFLWGAIQKSLVFQEVKRIVSLDAKSVYALPIARLEAEAIK